VNSQRTAPLSREDLLTDQQLARELGVGVERAVLWAESHGIRHDVSGIGRRTLWGDAIDVIRGSTEAARPAPVRRLPRKAL
jgi:hypothetical protein